MRKLTLDLNALRVQSFATDEEGPRPFGTVHGRQKNTGPETVCTASPGCASRDRCADTDEPPPPPPYSDVGCPRTTPDSCGPKNPGRVGGPGPDPSRPDR